MPDALRCLPPPQWIPLLELLTVPMPITSTVIVRVAVAWPGGVDHAENERDQRDSGSTTRLTEFSLLPTEVAA